jgi:hypothetical protein
MGPFDSDAALCASLTELRSKLPVPAQPPRSVQEVLAALSEFMECVRYLNTRRSEGAVLMLESEAAVQDAVYIMLRPWIPDLRYENPTDKVGNRYTIKDFLIPSARTVVEAKYVRDKGHGKSVSRELHDDIEMYSQHPLCDDLIFFIYDPDKEIPDVRALASDIVRPRQYGSKILRTYLIVRP